MESETSASYDSDNVDVNGGSSSATPLSLERATTSRDASISGNQIVLGDEGRPEEGIDGPIYFSGNCVALDTSSDESLSTTFPKKRKISNGIRRINGRKSSSGTAFRQRVVSRDRFKKSGLTHDRRHSSRSERNDLSWKSQKFQWVAVPPVLTPKSMFGGGQHPLPISDERSALTRVLLDESVTEDEGSDFNEVVVEDFTIYRSGKQTRFPWEMVTLDSMVSSRECCRYLLNGVLRRGMATEYIEGAEIALEEISIDGFEDTAVHSVQDKVYLRTIFCAKRRHKARGCWYRLCKPSDEYAVFYHKFLWVADLAKHVIDYLNWRFHDSDSPRAQLRDFRSQFTDTLTRCHGEDIRFQQWWKEYGQTDFRIPLNRHREFIFNRAFNLDRVYLRHDVWSDLMVRPTQPLGVRDRPPEDTVVTPYIYHCCRAMPWSYALKSEKRSESVERDHERRAIAAGMPYITSRELLSGLADQIPQTALVLERAAQSKWNAPEDPSEVTHRFAIVRYRQSGTGGFHHTFSYAYIQDTEKRSTRVELKVIFLYLPSETICLDGYYPRGNELFFSESCNCLVRYEPILMTDVVQLVDVTVGRDADPQGGFFVNQTYLPNEAAIVQMLSSGLRCRCRGALQAKDGGEKPNKKSKEPLRGLGLFAGCGNFDIGLEQAGGVEFVAAIDINEFSLKTYASHRHQGSQGLILDSVNSRLSETLQGGHQMPAVGSIDLISCGSPCKGFSKLNSYRDDDRGMRNCSLLASALSYVETHLPLYAIFENVPAMDLGIGNSCNQVIACLVGLGYQVRKMLLNSRNFCSAQNRDRLFIIATCPNLPPPPTPKTAYTPSASLKKASELIKGLPSVDNDEQICIPYPDHIAGVRQTPMFRDLIRRVPRYPKKMNFLESVQAGYQGPDQLAWPRLNSIRKLKNHRAFTRIDPNGVISTVTTTPAPACGFGGGHIIHWDDHRLLTLHEVKRAQGFQDEDVIVGDLPRQWAQVGNAVNRQVAAALGKVVADSWYSTRFSIQRGALVEFSVPEGPPAAWDSRAAIYGQDDVEPVPIDPSRRGLSADQIKKRAKISGKIPVDYVKREAAETGDLEPGTGRHVQSPPSIQHGTLNGGEVEGVKMKLDNRSEVDMVIDKAGDHHRRGPKIASDETEMLRYVFNHASTTSSRPNGNTQRYPPHQSASTELRFVQIQRRTLYTNVARTHDQHPNPPSVGSQHQHQQPVEKTSERTIEFRTKTGTPSSSPITFNVTGHGGTISNPVLIETGTEVSISKRKRMESESESGDQDEDGGGVRKWVGKRFGGIGIARGL